MCNHLFGYGGRIWLNPILGERELIPYRYCWTCGLAEKNIGGQWELALEWLDLFKSLGWAGKI